MRNLTNGVIAVAVFAIAFSADAYLPDTVPPIFAGQALAANPNSNDNGKSGQKGNGGKSAEAVSGSGNASSGGGPASGRGKGRGLLRLLTSDSATLPFASRNAPAGVATGPPLQLLPSQTSSAATGPVQIGPPEPRPVAPIQLLPSQAAGAVADNAPAGPPGPQSLEYYLEAGAGFNAAETADQEIVSTYEANLIAAVAAIEANSSFDATVDAYKAIAAIIAAFQEAENQSEDE